MSTERTWGITPPISTALPTPAETQASNELLEQLKREGTFESAEETAKRHRVLADIQRIVDEFVRRIAKKRHPHQPTLLRDARGEVFTYGSFCLGVYGPGSDIDTLVVAPSYVTRDDYFKVFPGLLEEMTPKGAVTDLTPVEEAFVPIIKFEYWDISIDLIFSRVAILEQFPPHGELKLTNDQYLRGLDEAELRSVNGTRVTNEILNLVPEQSTFRLALRAIKLWAQRRAIYANIIGFPGGVVWAMLVARVCQLYPRATSATIVSKFFFLIQQWPWPQPMMLKPMEDGPLNVRVWNPKVYRGDSFHLMPVITPAYPQMCATYNITRSHKEIIQRELNRAGKIAERIMSGKAPWKELFTKHSFFTQGYKYYLAIVVTSKEEEAHKIWAGFVESKVRLLVSSLERHQSIAIAHPFNKGFERWHKSQSDEQFEAIVEGSLAYQTKEKPKAETNGVPAEEAETKAEDGAKTASDKETVKSETGDEKKAKPDDGPASESVVYSTTHYIGLELVEGAKSLDLSFQVNEYKNTCYGWEKYKSDLNFLSVQHVKNINLPDDCFSPGEERPTKAPNKKRAAPVDNTNGRSMPAQRRRLNDIKGAAS